MLQNIKIMCYNKSKKGMGETLSKQTKKYSENKQKIVYYIILLICIILAWIITSGLDTNNINNNRNSRK